MKKGKNLQLIIIGLLVNSGSLIVSHYWKMPDLMSGFLMGTGISLLILSLLRQRFRPNC